MVETEEPTRVDVLVIGAGPSGLMLATWLSRCGIRARIVDKNIDSEKRGQADGLQSRTFEIFDSLGFGVDVWREANHMLEIHFWNPNERGQISRSDAIVDTRPGISRFQQATLHQGRIEDYLLRYIRKWSDLELQRGVMPQSLSIDLSKIESDDEYPISVTLQYLSEDDEAKIKMNGVTNGETNSVVNGEKTNGLSIPNGLHRSNLTADDTTALLEKASSDQTLRSEKILAKYVVGCDGSHSWTRRQIGSVMVGEHTDYVWGVLDTIPITDFPDIRYRCAIHSESAGSMMIIPREDKLVRMYIQITEKDETGKYLGRSQISPETLLKAAQKILAPYKFTYQHCHWWTAYGIGQRVGSEFSAHDRIFLAGDAVHTHSPKAGQGMNVSMHDTYNLGWKLASVIKGQSHRSLLKTYETERRKIAHELIDFDHKFSRLFSGRPSKDVLDKEGIDLKQFKRVFEKGNLFANGTGVNYNDSIIVAKEASVSASPVIAAQGTEAPEKRVSPDSGLVSKQQLATGIPIGMRMPSFKVLNQSDARPWELQELLPSNGCWRIVVFAGDLRNPKQFARVVTLGQGLDSADSFLHRYTPSTDRIDSVFEILTVHSSPRTTIDLLSLPDIFHPFSADKGWDYWKVYVDDQSYHEGHGQAYQNYGIDSATGCVVIIRPDQHVSWIGDLEDVDTMTRFFDAFMIPQQ